MELQDQLTIVTGVSQGIGLATAQALLARGAHVAGWSRTPPEQLSHPRFRHYPTDVGDARAVEQAHMATVRDFGTDVAVLINNAGLGYDAPIDELTPEQWHTMFDVNVHGLFYATRCVVPGMKRVGQGHILNVASIAGLNGVKHFSGYVATKHAVRGFSHSLYLELRDFGIKVTTIYPGSVQTNFFDNTSVQASEHMMRPQDIAQTIVQQIETHPNYFVADIEMRPLKPRG